MSAPIPTGAVTTRPAPPRRASRCAKVELWERKHRNTLLDLTAVPPLLPFFFFSLPFHQVQPTCGSPQTQVEAPTPTSDRVCSAPCTVSKCATCLPTSEKVCEHCTAGFYLLNGACVASCPPAAPVADPRTRRCRPCASGHVMLQAATSFAPPVCGSCANSSCYSCDSEDRIACTGCQLDEVRWRKGGARGKKTRRGCGSFASSQHALLLFLDAARVSLPGVHTNRHTGAGC